VQIFWTKHVILASLKYNAVNTKPVTQRKFELLKIKYNLNFNKHENDKISADCFSINYF
jgi:hypothetical protein